MTGGAGDGGPVQVFVDLTRFAADRHARAAARPGPRARGRRRHRRERVGPHLLHLRRPAPCRRGRPRVRSAHHARRGRRPVRPAGRADRGHELGVGAPGLLLRQFAQLAVLLGGERVTAGLGAGWSAEEFDALGLAMPKFRTRIDRLAEVLAVARSLWTDGMVTYDGDTSSPGTCRCRPCRTALPGCWWAAGRTGSWGWPGRFADLLDLHGDPKHGRVAGATMAQAAAGDVARRAHTTVEDLAGRIGLVRGRGGGGPPPRRRRGGDADLVRRVRLAGQVRAPRRSLLRRVGGHPVPAVAAHLLLGGRGQMAEALAERGGLRAPADLAQRGGPDRGSTTARSRFRRTSSGRHARHGRDRRDPSCT